MIRISSILSAACVLALPFMAQAAPAKPALTNELSAQQNKNKANAARTTTVRTRTNVNTGVKRSVTTTRVKTNAGSVTKRSVTTTNKPGVKSTTVIRRNTGTPKVVTFTGNRAVIGGRLRGARVGSGAFAVRGRNYSYWRGGPYRVRYGNGWRTFVAISALTAIAVAGVTYYPYAYLSAPQDYCDGLTEDGCQMTWQDVETVDGTPAAQCVAYCPWQDQ